MTTQTGGSLELLTSGQVAASLGLHLRKIQRLAEAGDLAYALQLPGRAGRYLFRPEDVEAFRRSRLEAAP